MSDTSPDLRIDSAAPAIAALERRVQAIEIELAALREARSIDARMAETVKAGLPAAEGAQAPTFKDIALPIPDVDTILATAKTTWTLFEMLNELNMLFWTLFDRRYHMAWFTRFLTIVLVVLIMTSHFWAPFAVYDNFISHLWDKVIDLGLGLILFTVLSFETRRYKQWRAGR